MSAVAGGVGNGVLPHAASPPIAMIRIYITSAVSFEVAWQPTTSFDEFDLQWRSRAKEALQEANINDVRGASVVAGCGCARPRADKAQWWPHSHQPCARTHRRDPAVVVHSLCPRPRRTTRLPGVLLIVLMPTPVCAHVHLAHAARTPQIHVPSLQLYTSEKYAIDAVSYYRFETLPRHDSRFLFALKSPSEPIPFVTQTSNTKSKPHADILYLHGKRQYSRTCLVAPPPPS